MARFLPARLLAVPVVVGAAIAESYEHFRNNFSLPDLGIGTFHQNVKDGTSSMFSYILGNLVEKNIPKKSPSASETGSEISPDHRKPDDIVLPASSDSKEKVNNSADSESKKVNELEQKVFELKQQLEDLNFKHQKEFLEERSRLETIIKKLEDDNEKLRTSYLLLFNEVERGDRATKNSQKSLVESYSEVLDLLSKYYKRFEMADTLPRVVVVGDQSSGKTSVLEMLAQTRMFPRGAGEMMTRTPVQVTLYEGPSRVACFADSDRIFNLTSEEELTELRREIYNRMQRAVKEEETVSAATISLYVQGPGLPRMVLVDLPGIINHVTTGMAEGTKETIWDMSRRQMANPNAIILCIQDGSVDAERSSVSDLVSSVDPTGSRTVLTKLDVAEANNIGSQRIKSVMEGKLFRMNALGYFAVIAGKGNGQESIEEIRQYEEEYFRNSRLFREGALSPHQTSLTNLSRAVSREFWRLVKETVADHFEQLKADLTKKETEWRNSFKGRPMSRDELFQLGKHVILESIDKFNSIGAKSWENILYERIWCDISGHLIDNIYMQAAKHFCPNEFRTRVDVELLDWARRSLTSSCIAASRDMFIREFENFIMNTSVDSSNDLEPLFKGMKEKIVANRRQQGAWLTAVSDNLRVIQLTALADDEICDEADWRNSCVFMEHRLTERKKVLDEQYRKYFGPEFWEQLFYWRSRDELQARRAAIRHELRDYFATGQPVEELSSDDIIGIRSNITRARSLEVDDEMIKEVYRVLFTNYFFKSSIAASRFCKNAYHFHDAELAYAPNKLECQDIIMFWRIQEMLKITSKTLRQQILMQKAHLEQEVKDELETYTLSDSVKKELIRGKRVELAEEIEIARVIKNKLENFIFQLKTQSSNLKEL